MRKMALVVGLAGVVLLLGGCGLFIPPGPSLGESPLIQGDVQNWTRGRGKVYFIDLLATGVYSHEGEISDRGHFSVRMKSGSELDSDGLLRPMKSSEDSGCTLSVEPDGVRVAMAQVLYYEPDDTAIWYVDNPRQGKGHAFLWYADKDAKISLKGSGCNGMQWDLQLKQGWNWVVTYTSGGQTLMRTELPRGFVWVLEGE